MAPVLSSLPLYKWSDIRPRKVTRGRCRRLSQIPTLCVSLRLQNDSERDSCTNLNRGPADPMIRSCQAWNYPNQIAYPKLLRNIETKHPTLAPWAHPLEQSNPLHEKNSMADSTASTQGTSGSSSVSHRHPHRFASIFSPNILCSSPCLFLLAKNLRDYQSEILPPCTCVYSHRVEKQNESTMPASLVLYFGVAVDP